MVKRWLKRIQRVLRCDEQKEENTDKALERLDAAVREKHRMKNAHEPGTKIAVLYRGNTYRCKRCRNIKFIVADEKHIKCAGCGAMFINMEYKPPLMIEEK